MIHGDLRSFTSKGYYFTKCIEIAERLRLSLDEDVGVDMADVEFNNGYINAIADVVWELQKERDNIV